MKRTTDRVVRLWNRDPSFLSFCEKFETSPISFVTPYDYEAYFLRLSKIKEILDRVTSIVRAPHIKSDLEETIVRSELAQSLDPESFRKTMHDPKMWKRKNGNLTPEFVYQQTHIDSIDIYENRFICLLIDRMDEEVTSIASFVETDRLAFGDDNPLKDFSLDDDSILERFEDEGVPFEDVFVEGGTHRHQVKPLLKAVITRLKHLKNTPFYKFLHDKGIEDAVVATNILIHDEMYSYAYRFYKAEYIGKEDNTQAELDAYFANFVWFALLNYLLSEKRLKAERNKDAVWVQEDKRLYLSNLAWSHKHFIYSIKGEPKGFTLEVMYRDNTRQRKGDAIARYFVCLTHRVDEVERLALEKKAKEGNYDDLFVISFEPSSSNLFKNLTLSPYQGNHREAIRKLLLSCSMVFACDASVFETKCPRCENIKLSSNGDHHECDRCHTKYEILENNLLWIKSFGVHYA